MKELYQNCEQNIFISYFNCRKCYKPTLLHFGLPASKCKCGFVTVEHNYHFKCPFKQCDASLSFDEFFEHDQLACNNEKLLGIAIDVENRIANREAAILKNVHEDIENQRNELKKLKNVTNSVIAEEKNARSNLTRLENELVSVKEEQRTLQHKETNISREIEKSKDQLNTFAKRKEELKNKGNKILQRGIFYILVISLMIFLDHVDEKNSCKVCFEPYDDNDHHQSCITKCFHTFCYSCLNLLDPKHCPTCRAPFQMSDVRKLF